MKKRSSNKIPVLVIFAPTASGKTALMHDLFSTEGSHFFLTAEIISADSQAVYKGMDIGTAKPNLEFCQKIPHHLINIYEPDQQCNVSDFVDLADKCCEDIYNRGKLAVLCGGTGYYIRSFLFGVPDTPMSDDNLRNQLKKRIEEEGNQALYDELKNIDPESAEKIHVNDSYRICRALEVFYLSGKTRSSFKLEPELRDKYDFLFLVLEPEREYLYERIRKRVDLMILEGLEKEISDLKSAGYNQNTPGLKAIGYSEWFEYENREKIIEEIKHHSCKYAKKQFTYIRDIPESKIINYKGTEEDYGIIIKLIKDKFSEYKDFFINDID